MDRDTLHVVPFPAKPAKRAKNVKKSRRRPKGDPKEVSVVLEITVRPVIVRKGR